MATRSLARCYPRQNAGVLLLLAAALTTFLVGIFLPFTRVTKLWIFEEDVSVWSSLGSLQASGEWFLFWVILLFTVVFPLVKVTALAVLWLHGGLTRAGRVSLHRWIGQLAKWSMLDVFIVALLVVFIKSGGIADLTMRDGLVVFTASVVLAQACHWWIGRIAERHIEG